MIRENWTQASYREMDRLYQPSVKLVSFSRFYAL
uniref:Uncharacterized protein n=1 Tax=Anguilla anguilla TaxID=7936 RepID=A0A0E9WEC5_ANGAN